MPPYYDKVQITGMPCFRRYNRPLYLVVNNATVVCRWKSLNAFRQSGEGLFVDGSHQALVVAAEALAE